ncbi:MAG TPA: response regulator [Candidatus Angelobacter sp.]|jgi:CheY-like chemotaxis protein|nr:response regulator [Candidatus Angelobacter sp.]
MKRILVVDDKATSRELLRTVLENDGYIVVEAADGLEAIRKAHAEKPALILLDLQLPLRSGYEVLNELRCDPQFVTAPIIALTASAMQGDQEKALAAGFTAYMTKPIALAHLRGEIKRILQSGEASAAKI